MIDTLKRAGRYVSNWYEEHRTDDVAVQVGAYSGATGYAEAEIKFRPLSWRLRVSRILGEIQCGPLIFAARATRWKDPPEDPA